MSKSGPVIAASELKPNNKKTATTKTPHPNKMTSEAQKGEI